MPKFGKRSKERLNGVDSRLINVLNDTLVGQGAVPTKNKYNLNQGKITTSANSKSGNNSANSSQELEVEIEKSQTQIVFSENFACPEHGAVMEELKFLSLTLMIHSQTTSSQTM